MEPPGCACSGCSTDSSWVANLFWRICERFGACRGGRTGLTPSGCELVWNVLWLASFCRPYRGPNYGACDGRGIAWYEATRRLACAWLEVPKDANIILRSVDRDTPGIPGRTMIRTVMDGKKIRQHWRCRRGSDCGATGSPERGGGTVTAGCHQLLVEQWMSLLCALGEEATNVFSEIDQRIQDIQSVTKLIRSVPGVDRTIACALFGEKGPGMSRFHHSLHLACSAGQSPPVNQQSAGHEHSDRIYRGDRWLSRWRRRWPGRSVGGRTRAAQHRH